jgi:hypothetical protein
MHSSQFVLRAARPLDHIAVVCMSEQGFCDQRNDLLRKEGFRENSATGGIGARFTLRILCRQQNDTAVGVMYGDPPSQLVAVRCGQVYLGEHEVVRGRRTTHLDGGLGVAGRMDLVPGSDENGTEQLPDLGLIIDDEKSCHDNKGLSDATQGIRLEGGNTKSEHKGRFTAMRKWGWMGVEERSFAV